MTELDDAVTRILAGLAIPESNGDQPVSRLDRLRGALLDTTAVENIHPPDPLVAGYLYRDTLATLYGPSGGGKTFLALDWSLHIATGSWWNSREIHAGTVLYVIAEGASGIGRRLAAWRQHHQIYNLAGYHPIWWLPEAVNLYDVVDATALTSLVEELQPVLVVVDTLARCALGAEENSARDMGIVVAHLDMIRRASGACVLVVHHSGVGDQNRARGSSAIRAAVDTELELACTDDRLTLKVTKQKDGAEPLPLHLTRKTVDPSCVITTARADEAVSTGALRTLESLTRIAVPGGVPATAWRAASDCGERTFYEHRSQLVREGLVRNLGTERSPRYTTTSRENTADA